MRIHEIIASAFGSSANLYTDVLQCSKKATKTELRKAYYRRALQFHPDKQYSQGGRKKQSQEQHPQPLPLPSSSSQQQQQPPKPHMHKNDDQTLMRFYAISAAYEILIDDHKRFVYDTNGTILEHEHQDQDEKEEEGIYQEKKKTKQHDRNKSQSKKNYAQQWNDFFQSVWKEMSTLDEDKDTYRGSDQEKQDVLKYYQICKGDMDKVLCCIQFATEKDKHRWYNDIIQTAIRNGHVAQFNDDHLFRRRNYKHKRRPMEWGEQGTARVPTTKNHATNKNSNKNLKQTAYAEKNEPKIDFQHAAEDDLVDTDDTDTKDGHDDLNQNKHNIGPATKRKYCDIIQDFELNDEMPMEATKPKTTAVMSKRDQLEYLVAKKRKERIQKRIELTTMIQGIQGWTNHNHHVDGDNDHDCEIRRKIFQSSYHYQQKNRSMFHEKILNGWGKKYAQKSKHKTTNKNILK